MGWSGKWNVEYIFYVSKHFLPFRLFLFFNLTIKIARHSRISTGNVCLSFPLQYKREPLKNILWRSSLWSNGFKIGAYLGSYYLKYWLKTEFRQWSGNWKRIVFACTWAEVIKNTLFSQMISLLVIKFALIYFAMLYFSIMWPLIFKSIYIIIIIIRWYNSIILII